MVNDALGEESSCGVLTSFADFIERRTEQIRSDWLRSIHEDERLQTSRVLDEPLLVDQLPNLLREVALLFRSRSFSEPDAGRSGQIHGMQRWKQGYRLEELVLEYTLLRSILIRHIAVFSEKTTEFRGAIKTDAIIRVHRFLDTHLWHSTQCFVDEQQAQLRNALDARLRLIRTVSHELRNILNGIGLAAQTIDALGEDALTELPELLGRNVQHMREILDDLLELSMLTSGKETVKPGQFTPRQLLEEIDATYRPIAESKGLIFSSEPDLTLGDVVSDELKTKQIVTNLVSNAVKYTKQGEVRVEFRNLDRDKWVAIVADTGVGISRDQQEQIFSEFYRVEETARVEGMGLGLSITTHLVQLLGGEVRLESEQGKGSRFEVILPKVFGQPSEGHGLATNQ